MRTTLFSICVLSVLVATAGVARANVESEAVEVGADFVLKKFGVKVTEELGENGAEVLARKMGTLAAKYGEKETVSAIERVGPQAFHLIEQAGEDAAPQAIRLMDRVGAESVWVIGRKRSMGLFLQFGDEAADAMIKHEAIAESLIERFGPSSARALKAIGGRNARRLAMMAEEGELAAIPQKAELLDTIGKYGDRAMEWVWNNKGAIITTAVAVKFMQNPQPFIDGTVKVADMTTDKLAKPVATHLAASIASNTNWTAVILGVLGAAFVMTLLRTQRGTITRWVGGAIRRLFKPRAAATAEISPEEASAGGQEFSSPDKDLGGTASKDAASGNPETNHGTEYCGHGSRR